MVGLCIPAHAADLGVPYLKAPPPQYTWSGFYAGANVGGAFSSEDVSIPLGTVSTDPSGVLAGGQVGYNLLVGPTGLVGIEGEFDWTSAQGNVVVPDPVAAATVNSSHNWYGTLEARAGFVLGPWLLYAKGGGTWMNADYALTGNFAGTGVAATASTNVSSFGWTGGVGVEYMLWAGWSAKVEYDFLDFGTQNVTIGGIVVPVNTQVHVAKLGVNYHLLP